MHTIVEWLFRHKPYTKAEQPFKPCVVELTLFDCKVDRVVEHHGAEHKVIHAYEHGHELTVESARSFSTLHPRCGTNFLLIVMIISVLMFTLLGEQSLLIRIASRVLLLPAVAGVSYEIMKMAASPRFSKYIGWMSYPGMMLQKLTTREPDDSQLEVAIRALSAVLTRDAGSITAPHLLPLPHAFGSACCFGPLSPISTRL